MDEKKDASAINENIKETEECCNLTQGDILRTIRDLRGLKIKDVSEETGIASLTIANIESNRSGGSIETLEKLADFFELSLDELRFWSASEKNKDVKKAKDLMYNLFIKAKAIGMKEIDKRGKDKN